MSNKLKYYVANKDVLYVKYSVFLHFMKQKSVGDNLQRVLKFDQLHNYFFKRSKPNLT